jgi:single-stranded-DNA-specific exonuclease
MDILSAEVDGLRKSLAAAAREKMGDGWSRPPLVIDGELDFALMDEELMRHIDRLEPFGEQNEAPLFVSRDLRLAEPPRIVGADRSHMILQLRRGSRVMKAMAFKMAARAGELQMGRGIDIVFSPRWNTFRGQTNLEVLLQDFRSTEG